MVITMNIKLDTNPICRCGNPSGELISGDGHCHCCDCNGTVVLRVFVGKINNANVTVAAASKEVALAYLRLSDLSVNTDEFDSWQEVQEPRTMPAVWSNNDVLRDFS